MSYAVRVARVYADRDAEDGTRVLVDRVWSRGMRKEDPRFDEWCKQAAPSSELRKWFGHDPERFTEFRERYLHELDGEQAKEAVRYLRSLTRRGRVTLVTATKDLDHCHARVLAEAVRR